MPSQKCPHAYECGKLYSALEVMDVMAVDGDRVVKAMARTFLFKLGLHGYEYGRQPHRCGAAIKRETLRTLTNEAIEILNDMTLRGRKSRFDQAQPALEESLEYVAADRQAAR